MLPKILLLACAGIGVHGKVIMHPGYDYAAIREKFQGPVLPVLTNYHQNLTLDLASIALNLESVITRGLKTGDAIILAAAAGGDFARMSTEQRKKVIDATIRSVAGRAPVVVSVQSSDVAEMTELAEFAEKAGADAIQLSPPFYYPTTVEDFNRTMALVMGCTKAVPVLVYNTPWEYNSPTGTAMDLGVAEIEMLANTWPRFLLLKWSSTNNNKYQRVIHAMSKRLAIIDNYDAFPTTYMLGGTGFISHFANVWPEWNVKVHRMLKAQDYRQAQDEISRVYWPWADFRAKIWARTALESPVVKGALDLLEGRVGGPVAEPARRLTPGESAELHALLKEWGVPGLKAAPRRDLAV